MVRARIRHAGSGHIAIADRLDLLEPVLLDERVEAREQLKLFCRDVSDVGFAVAKNRDDALQLGKELNAAIVAQVKKGNDPSDLVTSLLEILALLTPEEKKSLIAGLDPDVSKAMGNAYLLAQATANVPTGDEGLFALVHRTGRRVIGS